MVGVFGWGAFREQLARLSWSCACTMPGQRLGVWRERLRPLVWLYTDTVRLPLEVGGGSLFERARPSARVRFCCACLPCQVNGRPLVVLPRKNINMVSVHLTREDRQLYDR